MEDYNEVSFRDMVSEKIQKKDSERGAEAQMGFSLHGGKPIKELYRTVYTGGDDKGYCKEPIIDPKVVQTNDEGATEKTLKSLFNDPDYSDPSDQEEYEKFASDYESKYHSEHPDHYKTKSNGMAFLKPEYRQSFNDELDRGYSEHKEASVRDMIAQRNITGFAKGGVPYKTRQNKVDAKRAEAESLRTNDIDSGLDVALANHEADELEAESEPGDVLEEGAGNIGSQTWYHDVEYPSPVVDQQQIAIANDIQDDPSQSMRPFLGGDPVTKEKVVNSSLNERDDRIFNPQDHEPPTWKQNSGAYADAMIGTNRI